MFARGSLLENYPVKTFNIYIVIGEILAYNNPKHY
jgi:hypothetical protein